MFPKLYHSNETNFIHNGLGLLTGSISAVATEELNSMFELKIEYDSEGFLAEIIAEEMIIKAEANDKQDEQLFRIYSITKNHENDNLIIDAQHITYDLANNFVEKLEARNLTKRQVMQLIGSSTSYEHPFNVTSSNTTTQSSTSLYRTNPLQMIGGMEGSVLQIWGGQIERDNFNLIMHDRRGSDGGVLVTYKKNLTGLNAKFDISNLVTRIFPYAIIPATDDEPEQLITVPGKYIDSPHINNYEMPYILPVDFSYEEGIETSQNLLNAASNWFVETGRDNPRVEMEVQFEHLWETEEYKDVAALELVGMGDTITVKHSKLKVEGTAIVNRIEYDVIARKNIAVDVGNVKASFTDKVNQVGNIVDRVEQAEQSANQAIRAANGKNTIYYGPDEPTDGEVDDLWFKVVEGDYTETYRYDGIQWQLIVSKDVKDIEETANSAHNQANEAVEKANLATSNANEAIQEAQTAFDEAQTALTTANGASQLASTVYDLATALDTTVSGHTTTITDIENELSRKMTTVDADAKYATQSALQQTSQSLSSDIVAVQGNLDGLEIGGRNLVLDSKTSLTQVTISQYGMSGLSRTPIDGVKLKHGDMVTWSVYVSNIPSGQQVYPRIDWYRDDNTYSTVTDTSFRVSNSGRMWITGTIPNDTTFTSVRARIMPVNFTSSYQVRYMNDQIEKGNKATDWSPAPEDIQYQFTSINQTVSDVTVRVGNSEGDITALQTTATGFASRIEDAEGDINTLTSTAQGLQNRISDAEGNISSVTNTASALQTRMTNAEGGINTLTATASSLDSTIKSVRDDLDRLEIGGRNLILGSSDSYRNAYNTGWGNNMGGFVPVAGETYTAKVYIEPAQGDVGIQFVYMQNGVQRESGVDNRISSGSAGYVTSTFTFPQGTISTWIQLRNSSNVGNTANLVRYKELKAEKGNKATDWSPAPEDMATQSQITQLSNNINARVEKGDVINQINISDESILISGRKLILDGNTTVNGTFRVANANITSVDAGKMTTGTLNAANVSIINLSANSIRGGILSSQNSNTTFNLNTGQLSMHNNNITFGTGANIEFESPGNTLVYRKYDSTSGYSRAAGLGVGDRVGGRYSFAYLGTNGSAQLDTLDPYFTGLIVNTNAAIANDGASNSIAGHRFQLRNQAVGWDKGITFDFYSNPEITLINGASNNYSIGPLFQIKGRQNFNVINYYNNRSGWFIETQYSGGGAAIQLRGQYSAEFNYQVGSTAHRIQNIYLRNQPNVSSDKRLKQDIDTLNLGLDFINDLNVVSYRMKLTDADIGQGIDENKIQYGFVAQELKKSLTTFNVDTEKISLIETGEDGMYGISYEQLIAPTIKAVQDLDKKVNLTREELILKIAELENRINKLESVA